MIDRYAREEMRTLWSDRTRYETWLDVELAACRQMERLGIVPEGTADRVRLKVTLSPERILEIEMRVRHDVIAFLTHVEEQAGEPARWLHLGMTSSDVLDTAFGVLLRQAGRTLMDGVDGLMAALRRRATETREVPMVGRTHGIHAEATSLGLAFAGFYAEMKRNRQRLTLAVDGISVGKIAGAVGVYGNVSPDVEEAALSDLGLQVERCATQIVARDRHAEYFCVLAQVASSVERIALQVRHWQRTEVGELFEPFGSGQKGSSAMPHKRNPVLCENLCGLARLMRGYAQAALENVALWHERDISHSSVERVIAPDATATLDFMLHRVTRVVEGLEVAKERIQHNLEYTGGLIFSEAVLLALVSKGLPRQRAYELVQAQAMAAQQGQGSFKELLGSDPEIATRLTGEQIDACFDVKYHLQHVGRIFQRVFGSEEGGHGEMDRGQS